MSVVLLECRRPWLAAGVLLNSTANVVSSLVPDVAFFELRPGSEVHPRMKLHHDKQL